MAAAHPPRTHDRKPTTTLSGRHIDFAEFDVPLLLRGPGVPLAATARSLTVVRDDGEIAECTLELEFDLAGYRIVDEQRLLHLDPEMRGPGSDGFAPDGPVLVEARLEPELVPELLAESTEPLDVGRRLGELSRAGAESPLLATDAWYALAVRAPVELPEELALDGSLQAGYSTRWAGDSGGRLELTMLAIVEQVLEDRGWEQDEAEDDEDVIRWRMSTEHGAWTSYALARELDGRLAIYSVLDVVFPADRLHDGALLVTRANHGLPVGNWEVDLDDGTVRCKTSIALGGERLSIALASALIEHNLAIVDAYLEGFTAFAAGRMTVEEALALSEG